MIEIKILMKKKKNQHLYQIMIYYLNHLNHLNTLIVILKKNYLKNNV